MFIGGFQKSSLIDYPGKISCIIFLFGCNFRCPYCHNPGLVRGDQDVPSYLTEKWILNFLKQRSGLLEGVVITGGEPTLHKELIVLCKKIKNLGYNIKLDTNGSKPEVVKKLIDNHLIDYCAMDIKTHPKKYTPILSSLPVSDNINTSISIIKDSDIPNEFRTTCVHPFIDKETINVISKLIQGANRYVLQRFQHTHLLNSGFFDAADPHIDDNQLNILKTIAAPKVNECIVR